MLGKDLIERNIEHITVDDTVLFDVKDIKEKTTDIFVKSKEIVEIKGKLYISAKHLRFKTEFDYIMERTLKPDTEN